MKSLLPNRTEAGRLLAAKLTAYANRKDVLVLALPRGGVPVGFEIAQQLHSPLDVCLVRKLGVPGREELAMGAIAFGGVTVTNADVLDWLNIDPGTVEQVAAAEQRELERRNRVYRDDRPLPQIRDRIIILVDDGIATGSTLSAALTALRQQHPRQVVIAVPVAPLLVYQQLKTQVDEIVCLFTPESFRSLSLWYQDFSQTTDQEVRHLLASNGSKAH